MKTKAKTLRLIYPPFQMAPEGIKMKAVQFADQKAARDFLAKAQKAPAEFESLAKAAKKDIKDLGLLQRNRKISL